ncbi:MAG: type II toxin-antitoxin system VapC family toxin [Phenylobacterium sp.]|nr:type II toxin-antitoxin system VapC family toxin [Phenylobacterium sp.]
MSVYLDTSVLVSMVIDDGNTGRARLIASRLTAPMVSDFAAAEFASALATRFRAGTLTEPEVRSAHAVFDSWRLAAIRTVEIVPSDVLEADRILRTLRHALRAPDAIHVAAATRLGARLATLDLTMAREARVLGLDTIDA